MINMKIEHIRASPHHQQANGKAENAVKIVKNLMRKSEHSGSDFYIGLLAQRNTPTAGMT